MNPVCIGVHVHAEPERLHATLASIAASTAVPFGVLLLPDGPDEASSRVLETLTDIPQSATVEPRGTAACFNRLAAVSLADTLVLLESGSIVGVRWLEHLLAALDADTRNGLAGPTTNLCWNEQAVFRHAGGSGDEIAKTSADARDRFGSMTRTLEPLYSLADFCYVVRRAVIDAVGQADEGYGLGPCWEMDYNIRAARAGFRGVWAGAAYVYRSPFTARRRVEERRRFETSRHRYQDKFCGARLQGIKSDYRYHCRGAACPNFAPASLIARRETGLSGVLPVAILNRPPVRSVSEGTQRRDPLATCIMPTANRRIFIGQAIRCFLRQDYPNLELVVVDDGADAIADCLPDDPRIRCIRLDRHLSVGAKRNLACSHARGEIIVHWDDDDWYPPWRVQMQVRALIDRGADICGTSRLFYYEPAADRAWEYRYESGRPNWLAGNTLAYRKAVWQRTQFADVQVGEDAMFLWNSGNAGLCDLADQRLCVGMVHGGNVSPKHTGGMYWHVQPAAAIRALLTDDLHFYRTMPGAFATWPLVSCIMPTYNRHGLVRLALQLFARQDYPNRELIVVDDSDRGVGDLAADAPNVRYFHFGPRRSIGAKRNFACEQARGNIIAHWDDDDWYAPERLRYQVAPLLTEQAADITGLEDAVVLETANGRFWTTRRALHGPMFFGGVHGGTLVFRKQLFDAGLRYRDVSLAEDAWFLHEALQRGKRLVPLSNAGVFVYMRHGRNAWKECVPGRFRNPAAWERVERPPMFSESVLLSYQAATATAS